MPAKKTPSYVTKKKRKSTTSKRKPVTSRTHISHHPALSRSESFRVLRNHSQDQRPRKPLGVGWRLDEARPIEFDVACDFKALWETFASMNEKKKQMHSFRTQFIFLGKVSYDGKTENNIFLMPPVSPYNCPSSTAIISFIRGYKAKPEAVIADGKIYPMNREAQEHIETWGETIKAFLDDPKKFVESKSKEHSICSVCMTPLTNAASIEKGMGPVCRRYLTSIEGLVKNLGLLKEKQ